MNPYMDRYCPCLTATDYFLAMIIKVRNRSSYVLFRSWIVSGSIVSKRAISLSKTLHLAYRWPSWINKVPASPWSLQQWWWQLASWVHHHVSDYMYYHPVSFWIPSYFSKCSFQSDYQAITIEFRNQILMFVAPIFFLTTGYTMTTVAEEKLLNPRLTLPKDKFIQFMKELNLAYPKLIGESAQENLVNNIFR